MRARLPGSSRRWLRRCSAAGSRGGAAGRENFFAPDGTGGGKAESEYVQTFQTSAHLGEIMDASAGPDLDTTELRSHYNSAITAYESAARALNRNRVVVRSGQFGEGFAPEGVKITQALEELHEATLAFLDARAENWQRIIELAREVELADQDSAGCLCEVEGL